MEFPCDSFAAVKLTKAYTDREQIKESGMYFDTNFKTFDCWYVGKDHTDKIKTRIMIVQISHDVAFSGGKEQKDIYDKALHHLEEYAVKRENTSKAIAAEA